MAIIDQPGSGEPMPSVLTVWFTLLWALIGWALVITIIGLVVGVPILIALTLWLIYRIGRGWLRLRDRRPMYVP